MRDLRRWTIAVGLAAAAGAGIAYLARGGPVARRDAGSFEADAGPTGPAASSADAHAALDEARARLRARAEELRREIQDGTPHSH